MLILVNLIYLRVKEIFLKTGIISLFLFFLGMGCENKFGKPCDVGEVVKSVNDKKGFIWYDSQSRTYSVFASIEGTYDSQDIGIPCDMPDNYKKEGIEILFSGNYFKCKEFSPSIPGQTYYYLELIKIKSLK